MPALAGTRWSIHDVVLDDLSAQYVGAGTAFEIMNAWPTTKWADVVMVLTPDEGQGDLYREKLNRT